MLRGGFCPEASLLAMSKTLRTLKSAPSGRHDDGLGLSIIHVKLVFTGVQKWNDQNSKAELLHLTHSYNLLTVKQNKKT
jgi:hypothetical protein